MDRDIHLLFTTLQITLKLPFSSKKELKYVVYKKQLNECNLQILLSQINHVVST